MAKESTKLPYKPAHTVKSEKGWYIEFYAWDAGKSILRRVRYYDGINTIEDLQKRGTHCMLLCRDINQQLKEGYHYKATETGEKETTDQVYTIAKAIDYVVTQKEGLRPKSYLAYKRAGDMFRDYLTKRGLVNKLPQEIQPKDIVFYRDWLHKYKTIHEGRLKMVSINNLMSLLRTLFYDIKLRGWITENPTVNIARLQEEEHSRYYSFNNDQLPQVKEHMSKANPYVWTYAQWIFYSFIRPGELRFLKVENIDLKKNIIEIPPSISKNKKWGYVQILPPLLKIIEEMQISKYPRHYYVFGNKRRPSETPLGRDTISKAFAAELKKMDYPEGYSLYSMKHTGVERHFLLWRDIKKIQAHCRHANLEDTDRYLKRLGLNRMHEVSESVEI